jgi:hypothetical protein
MAEMMEKSKVAGANTGDPSSGDPSSPPPPKPDEGPSETLEGEAESHKFEAETKQLLEIVAKSLYTDKEVFVRELISNASDALEKRRHLQLMSADAGSTPMSDDLEIRLSADPTTRKLVIQDEGVGMKREELVDNLGCIARSGARAALPAPPTPPQPPAPKSPPHSPGCLCPWNRHALCRSRARLVPSAVPADPPPACQPTRPPALPPVRPLIRVCVCPCVFPCAYVLASVGVRVSVCPCVCPSECAQAPRPSSSR